MKNLLKIFAPENRSLLCTIIISATAITVALILRPARYSFSSKNAIVFDSRTGRTHEPFHKIYCDLDGTEHKTGEQ